MFVEIQRDTVDSFMEFVAYLTIGVLVGLTASIMSNIEEHVTALRRDTTDDIISNKEGNLVSGWLFFTGLSCGLVLCASALTIFWVEDSREAFLSRRRDTINRREQRVNEGDTAG